MTLRSRLAASILLSFILALVLGSAIVFWRAQRSVQTEMQGAPASDVDIVKATLAIPKYARDIRFRVHLVRSFDEQRHVRTVLWIDQQHSIAVSHLAASPDNQPAWFEHLLAPVLRSYTFTGPGNWHLMLQTDSRNEIGEVWSQSCDALLP